MDAKQIRQVAADWIEGRGSFSGASQALDGLIQTEPLTAFRVIEEICHRIVTGKPDYELMGLLAAGPLEDLLAGHGDLVIAPVELLARQDAEFRKCLAGVWRKGISDEVYARVQRAADPSWRFA